MVTQLRACMPVEATPIPPRKRHTNMTEGERSVLPPPTQEPQGDRTSIDDDGDDAAYPQPDQGKS
jgi:hypothetical protein